jgi:hypothetical protein
MAGVKEGERVGRGKEGMVAVTGVGEARGTTGGSAGRRTARPGRRPLRQRSCARAGAPHARKEKESGGPCLQVGEKRRG